MVRTENTLQQALQHIEWARLVLADTEPTPTKIELQKALTAAWVILSVEVLKHEG